MLEPRNEDVSYRNIWHKEAGAPRVNFHFPHNGFKVYFNPKTDGSLTHPQKIIFLRYWKLYFLGTFWGPPLSKDMDRIYRKENECQFASTS
jgi:hypothetical protein